MEIKEGEKGGLRFHEEGFLFPAVSRMRGLFLVHFQ